MLTTRTWSLTSLCCSRRFRDWKSWTAAASSSLLPTSCTCTARIQSEIPGFSGFNTDGGLFGQVEVQKPTFSHTISASPETLSALRGISREGLTVRETDSGEVKVTVIGGIDASLEESIIATVPESERRDLSNAVESYRTLNRHLLSPAERGEKLGIPRLMSEIQGSLEFADTDVFMEYSDWSLLNHPARSDENEFTIREMARSFEIDIDGRQVRLRWTQDFGQVAKIGSCS